MDVVMLEEVVDEFRSEEHFSAIQLRHQIHNEVIAMPGEYAE